MGRNTIGFPNLVPTEKWPQIGVGPCVLGDLGHSPRIMNQALSLIKADEVTVTMFGYCECALISAGSEQIKRGKLIIVPMRPLQLRLLPPFVTWSKWSFKRINYYFYRGCVWVDRGYAWFKIRPRFLRWWRPGYAVNWAMSRLPLIGITMGMGILEKNKNL